MTSYLKKNVIAFCALLLSISQFGWTIYKENEAELTRKLSSHESDLKQSAVKISHMVLSSDGNVKFDPNGVAEIKVQINGKGDRAPANTV